MPGDLVPAEQSSALQRANSFTSIDDQVAQEAGQQIMRKIAELGVKDCASWGQKIAQEQCPECEPDMQIAAAILSAAWAHQYFSSWGYKLDPIGESLVATASKAAERVTGHRLHRKIRLTSEQRRNAAEGASAFLGSEREKEINIVAQDPLRLPQFCIQDNYQPKILNMIRCEVRTNFPSSSPSYLRPPLSMVLHRWMQTSPSG